MRVRGYLGLAGAVVLGACAHAGPPPPPSPPPPGATLQGDPQAGIVAAKPPKKGRPLRFADTPDGLACRYCITDDPAKRQYFDQRRKRYYYFDRTRKAYFWEDGEPKT